MAYFQLDNTGEDTGISAQFALAGSTGTGTNHDIIITNLSSAAVDIYLGQVTNVGIDPSGTVNPGDGHVRGHHPLSYRSLDLSGHNVDLKGLQAGATIILRSTVYGSGNTSWPASTSVARTLHRTSAQDDDFVVVAPVTGANQILPR